MSPNFAAIVGVPLPRPQKRRHRAAAAPVQPVTQHCADRGTKIAVGNLSKVCPRPNIWTRREKKSIQAMVPGAPMQVWRVYESNSRRPYGFDRPIAIPIDEKIRQLIVRRTIIVSFGTLDRSNRGLASIYIDQNKELAADKLTKVVKLRARSDAPRLLAARQIDPEIGRASCRERGEIS